MNGMKMKDMAAGLAPAAAAMIGVGASAVGIQVSFIVPEHERMLASTVIWSLIAAGEIAIIIATKGSKVRATRRWGTLRCIQAAAILTLMVILSAMYSLFGIDSLFICGLRTTPFICMLFVAAIIMLAASETRIAKLLITIAMGLTIAAWISPVYVDSWDGLKYSADVFRVSLLCEEVIMLYIMAILPAARSEGNSVQEFLRSGICRGGPEISDYVLKRIRILQITLALCGTVFALIGSMAMGYLFAAAVVVFVSGTSEAMGSGKINRYAVALPVFIKLLYDLGGNDLITHSDFYAVYIGFGVLALIAALKAYRGLFRACGGGLVFVHMIELLVYCSSFHSYAEYVSTIYTTLGEVLILLSMTAFCCWEWSTDLLEDLFTLIEKDEDLIVELSGEEEE